MGTKLDRFCVCLSAGSFLHWDQSCAISVLGSALDIFRIRAKVGSFLHTHVELLRDKTFSALKSQLDLICIGGKVGPLLHLTQRWVVTFESELKRFSIGIRVGSFLNWNQSWTQSWTVSILRSEFNAVCTGGLSWIFSPLESDLNRLVPHWNQRLTVFSACCCTSWIAPAFESELRSE